MEGVSNNVVARKPYSATKKSAAVGAGLGAIGAAGTIVAAKCSLSTIATRKYTDFTGLKMWLGLMKERFAAAGKDMSKTTVSKAVKSAANKQAAKALALWTGIGLAAGMVIDMSKNYKAKKAQNIDKA